MKNHLLKKTALLLPFFLLPLISCNKVADINSIYTYTVSNVNLISNGYQINWASSPILDTLIKTGVLKERNFQNPARNNAVSIKKNKKMAISQFKSNISLIEGIDMIGILKANHFTSCQGSYTYSLSDQEGVIEQKNIELNF